MSRETKYVYTCDMCGEKGTSYKKEYLPPHWRKIVWYSQSKTVGYTAYCRQKSEFHICREKFCLLNFAELKEVKGSEFEY